MKKVSFHTLGCKVNFAESSTLAREFAAAGFERAGRNSDGDGEGGGGAVPSADVYVVNTCSVTAHADKKCRNLIARLHRRSPNAVIAVTGCWAQLNPEAAAATAGVDFVFGNNCKEDIAGVMARLGKDAAGSAGEYDRAEEDMVRKSRAVASGSAEVSEAVDIAMGTGGAPTSRPVGNTGISGTTRISGTSGAEVKTCPYSEIDRFFAAYSAGDRTRSFLKVQDGCDYKCSYCTIHYARGGSRNIPIAQAVAQAREIAARGIREIVLTGINTGDFGRTTGERFIDLLRALDEVEGIERYRISSIEPNLLTDGIIELCAASRKFQPHFHIPLQSGCDRILGLMRRLYTAEKFADRVARVRELMPETFFGVDVIVGFPGETDADFDETYRFLEALAPAQLHVFPFSERPGTPAAAMPGKVSPKIATARAARLGELSRRLHSEFIRRFEGTRAKVLFEGGGQTSGPAGKGARKNHAGTMYGFTENYIRIGAPYDPALVDTIVEVTVRGIIGI